MNNHLEHPGISRVLATGSPYLQKGWGGVDEDAIYEERRERMLFPAKGGSPCDACWRQQVCDNGCDLWERDYLMRQRKINAYAKAAYQGQRKPGRDVFAYSHPDMVRRYEKTYPCEGCGLRKGCKMPCGRYIHWYDLRMELARKRAVLS